MLGVFSSTFFYFAPIHNLLLVLVFIFSANFIGGMITSIRLQDESFNFKKAWIAFKELVVFSVFLASAFFIGDKMDSQEWINEFLSIITWVLIYFYTANIFKNLRRLFPNSKGIHFLWFVLNFEFAKRFSVLKEFQVHQKNKKDETNTNP